MVMRSPSSSPGRETGNRASRKAPSIYPVLRALAAVGFLSSRLEPSYTGPPRRYYRITPEGRRTLSAWCRIWQQTRDFVDPFLKTAHAL